MPLRTGNSFQEFRVNDKIRFVSTWMLSASLGLLAGCPGDDEDGRDTAGATDGSATNATDNQTSGDSDSDSSTPTTGSSDTADTADPTTDTTATATTGPMDPLPNGESCDADEQCESGKCFIVGIFGGICGECNTDDDCSEWGCSLPNPLSDPPVGAMCGDGQIGSGCESEAACDGLLCATILDVPGVVVRLAPLALVEHGLDLQRVHLRRGLHRSAVQPHLRRTQPLGQQDLRRRGLSARWCWLRLRGQR